MINRAILTAAVLALAATNLPTRDEPIRHADPILPQPGPDPDPEGERVKAELRERRRQNFLKQRKA